MYAGGAGYPVEENLAPALGRNRSESCKSYIMGDVTRTPPFATWIPTLKIDKLAIYKEASERDPPSLWGAPSCTHSLLRSFGTLNFKEAYLLGVNGQLP